MIRTRYPETARALDESAGGPAREAVAAERFSPPGDRWHGHWRTPPKAWSGAQVAALQRTVEANLPGLPPIQRAIVLLHDCEELSIQLVSRLLELDEAHCKHLYHVARSQLWAASERDLASREEA